MYSDDILESSSINDVNFEIPKDNKNKEIDRFDKLTFSPDSENLEQIHVEIEADTNEFVACKHLIFY